MFMESKAFRLKLALIAVSTFLVCSTLFSYTFISDKQPRLLYRSSSPSSQALLSSHNLTPYPARLSNVRLSDVSLSRRPSKTFPYSRTLGIASHIFVISLPRRIDRRILMNALSQALDLEFIYVDGAEATDACIDRAMHVLKAERNAFRDKIPGQIFPEPLHVFNFSAPEEGRAGAPEGSLDSFDNPLFSASLDSILGCKGVSNYEGTFDIPCATPDDPFPASLTVPELSLLPPWRILSRAMIACWIGHLNVIRKIAKLELDAAVVLEDDVDMEYDITSRLMDMWSGLPQDGWDIVMLGHCHSNETVHPPLHDAPSLRPSFAPKCTHAYVISGAGAKRLSWILSIPGFAYSRALDQALSWLINTGRLRSYSVVPAIIVQNKRTDSDIWRARVVVKQPGQDTDDQRQTDSTGSDKGSTWRDALMDSTLERLEMMAH